MKVKEAKKYAEKRFNELKPILTENSGAIENALDACVDVINSLTESLIPFENQEVTDTFHSFICHGISVALIQQKNKGENNK